MKVNQNYLGTMYVAFGWEARERIEECVKKIIATLESMPADERNAIFNILNPEVKKAIDNDFEPKV